MQTVQLDLTKRYSYADYLTWIDDKRRELFDGLVKLMSPAPMRIHQDISGEIFNIFKNYLKKKTCKVYHAPFDVRFPSKNKTSDNDIFTVVQPDISIVCDLSKLDRRGCLGAPDMIIEIVSEGNSSHDVKDKFEIYQENGVREYWIVFPESKVINVFTLNEAQKYQLLGMFAEKGKIKVNIFDDFYIDLEEIFDYTPDE